MYQTILLTLALTLVGCADQQTTPAEHEPVRALIVGGNTSHDFERWFHMEDAATLNLDGVIAGYTENPDEVLGHLDDIDVLYLANNQALPDPGLRQAIFDWADEGKPLLLVHPALWYNWGDWPEYNRDLVGGGSLSHGPYGPFEISVTQPDHPIMAGIPKTFTLEDELYRFKADPNGARMNVLAIGTEPDTGIQYPIAWTIDHPTRRIVCITLGHDGATHQSDAYKTLLRNSLKWLLFPDQVGDDAPDQVG